MDLEDLAELGFMFGGFEIIETLATVAVVLVVLALIVGAVVLLSPDLGTILVLLAVSVGSGIAGGLVGMKVERLRRKVTG